MNEIPLAWSIDTGSLAHSPADFSYEASGKELDALKRYAGVEDLTAFKARVRISPLSGGKFRASGTLQASVVQASVVNLEAVSSSIEENFSVEYWPAELIGEAGRDASLEADPPEAIIAGHIPHRLTAMRAIRAVARPLSPQPRRQTRMDSGTGRPGPKSLCRAFAVESAQNSTG